MSNLRKMLGDIHDESVIELMKLISTQSHLTLIKWGLMLIQDELKYLNNLRLFEIEEVINEYLNNKKSLKEIKSLINESRQIAKNYNDPISIAAAYSICTSFGIISTPTNSLGFTFYHAAFIIYHKYGLKCSKEFYDNQAKELYKEILVSFKKIMIEKENNPVKVNWNC